MPEISWIIQAESKRFVRTSPEFERLSHRRQKEALELSGKGRQIVEERNLRKTRTGIVVSDKMDKTIVVAIKTT